MAIRGKVSSVDLWEIVMNRAVIFGVVLAASAGVYSGHLQAQEVPTGWNVSMALGYGAIENPLKAAHNPTTFVLPNVQYYGERFYAENFTLGYSLLETRDLLIDVETRLNDDGLFFELNGLQQLLATDLFNYEPRQTPINGRMVYPDIQRSVSYLGGLAVRFPTAYGQLSLGHYRDISSVHYGSESHLRYQLQGELGSVKWGLELGTSYKDQALVDYYYHASKEEISGYRVRQTTGGTHNYHSKVVLNMPINPQWFYVLTAEHVWLGDGIASSVLVKSSQYSMFFVGVGYAF